MQPFLLKTLYILRRYQVMGLTLERWAVVLLLLAALLLAVGLLPGGLAGALICLALLLALFVAAHARR